MGRNPREQTEGSLQHVTVRGNRGVPIFVDNHDRRVFLAALEEAGRRARWTLLSFCLMTNHAHLLLRLEKPRLSLGMHFLNTTHAHRFNARHAMENHLFGQRYHSSPVETDDHLQEVFRYIALNPWRAGMTPRQDDWNWSAHRSLAGISPCPDLLNRAAALAYFESDAAIYRAFVAEGERKPIPPTLEQLVARGEGTIAEAHFEHGYSQREIARAFRLSQTTVFRRLNASSTRRAGADGARAARSRPPARPD